MLFQRQMRDVAGAALPSGAGQGIQALQHTTRQCDVYPLNRVIEQSRIQRDDAEGPSGIIRPLVRIPTLPPTQSKMMAPIIPR